MKHRKHTPKPKLLSEAGERRVWRRIASRVNSVLNSPEAEADFQAFVVKLAKNKPSRKDA
jgi:hypothetical protein